MKPRPTLPTKCIWCNAPQKMDKLHTRVYECGTTGDRDKGVYNRKCRKNSWPDNCIVRDCHECRDNRCEESE